VILGVSLESLRTPSSHASSLRKLEQNLSQVFDCCGKRISTVDGLIEHYEMYHSEPMQVDTAAYGEIDNQNSTEVCTKASSSIVTDEWFELGLV